MASILAVDDSAAIRKLISLVLSEGGYTVFVKENGYEALDFAKNHTVDLVITDLNMPQMNGMDLVTNLRLLDNYQYKPILVMTVETADYKKEKAKMLGATGWIEKPINKAKLLDAVQKAIN
ncbi:response regulator [Oceaniserpentilla sp. 4NH20-0058]|uniref:response regulator n=1 Tax=Oceaniserpentilla sp. 4NH20-0058 TaxID=3127660 RepID=UPI0031087B13